MKINNVIAKKRIFVVEESDNPTESLVVLLRDIREYEIIGFTNNKTDALNIIIEEKPDVVIFNIRMSGGKNLHFIYKVRETNENAKIIILAEHTDGHYRKASEMLNVDDFLDKTRDIGKLYGILSDYSSRHSG